MNQNKEARIKEIDKKIAELEKHIAAWTQAGGQKRIMADNARVRILELSLEKDDLINGTNKHQIYELDKEIRRYQDIRDKAGILMKSHYGDIISKLEEKKKGL